MRFKKILSMTLILCMLMGLFPMSVQAADSTAATGDLFLNKTAILENDGTYTIQLEAYATGTPVKTQVKTGKSLQIVIVVDQSGSVASSGYLDDVKESITEFVEVVAANGRNFNVEHKVAIVGFASDIDDGESSGTNCAVSPGSSETEWINTGIFNSDGILENYSTTTEIYDKYTGELSESAEYFVKLSNGKYAKLMYEEDSYSVVAKPETNRVALWAYVDGQFVSVFYGQYDGYVNIKNRFSMVDEGTYYIDDPTAGKVAITYTKVFTESTYSPKENRLGSGTLYNTGDVYYVELDDGTMKRIECTREEQDNFIITEYSYIWTTDEGSEYDLKADDKIYKLKESAIRADNGESVEITDTTKIYEKVSKTAWGYTTEHGDTNIIDSTEMLYERTGSSAWLYESISGQVVAVTNETIYIKESGDLNEADYRDALVSVTDGESGAGNITSSITTSISNISSSGGTRTSYGMEMASKVFQYNHNVGEEHGHVVVVFTDGKPGETGFADDEANASLVYADDMKKNYDAEIYTVGLYGEGEEDSDTTIFMNALSSNFAKGKDMETMRNLIGTTYVETDTPSASSFSYSNNKAENLNLYYLLNGTYYPVYVKRRNRLFYYTYTWYCEGSSSALDINTVQLYKGVPTFPTADDNKYYQTTSDTTALNGIFTNIVQDSTTTSTTVVLTAESILRDIMGTGMELVSGVDIVAERVPGTWNTSATDITWGTPVEYGRLDFDDPETDLVGTENHIKVFNTTSASQSDGQFYPHTVDVKGFDYQKEYIAEGHPGSKLVVTITGVEASPYAVWNQVMFTNNDYSGIWTPQTETQDRELKASFIQPTTLLTSTNYVVDYAKPFTMDVAADLGMSAIAHLDSDDTNKFSEAKTTISDKFGSISKTGTTTLQYTPKNINWSDVESFYVFGKTENEFILAQTANKVYSNLWSRVNVIPANNVYYEDTFVTDESAGTVGIEYSGDWTTDGSASGNTETVNGAVHGWEDSLSNDTGYSDGSAHKSDTVGATATFTFTGTGVDVYSRTDMTTGIVMAMLFEGDSVEKKDAEGNIVTNANGNAVNKPVKKLLMVDGLGASEGGKPYYQIPTLSFENLDYGTYTVKIVVSRAVERDPETNKVIEGTERSTFYLDGIRVYNPVDTSNSVVQDAYGEEMNAVFAEVRDSLLTAGNFGSGDGVSGAVYVDEDGDGKMDKNIEETGAFESIGSKNEVYLSKGQGIAFSVNYNENARYFVGLKSVEGTSLGVNITGEAKTIAHSTDLYYEVSKEQLAANGGIITVINNGTEVLAITKLKVINVSPTTISVFSLRPEAELAAYAKSLDTSEEKEPTTPEVEIVNPETGEERNPELDSVVDKLFTDIYGWFQRTRRRNS